ncbi:MAG: N-acetylmuramoyl-L-alanine amidase, partial [Chloroflexales bacterium]|nr:N-acetylmuramoyl-L-alanine amidase [Chloroflexales bacterium]
LRTGWYSIGLEMVGYFDQRRPAGAVWDYAKAVMGGLSRRLHIPPRQLISFHRDYTNQKSCPGWAVTKEWVWGEVDAWLNNSPPPTPPPPGDIGIPTPSDEQLLETLLNESYAQRTAGQGYNSDWAFHQFAVQNRLGMPMAKSERLTVAGKNYNYQPFARDTVFCEIPNWGDVQLLSELLAGSIPPAGLGRALLDITFQTGGATFRPEWAFHQFAMSAKLGPPLGESALIRVNGVEYSYQVFALDTLYNQVPNWSDVKQLSRLANTRDASSIRLRDALLAESYKRVGTTYHPEWAFHQLARSFNIGVALSRSYKVKLEGTTYAIQVYAWDTLYNIVPNWSDVRRLSALGQAALVASFNIQALAAASADLQDVQARAATAEANWEAPAITADANWEPPSAPDHTIVQYSPSASATSDREGAEIEMVVLHGLAGAAATRLAQMTAIGARFTTHYYIANDGAIYQLAPEQRTAWHAGIATIDGLWLNLNRSSIGIALERPHDWPGVVAETSDAQLAALRWLLRQLTSRYRLKRDSIILWGHLAASPDPSNDSLPFEVLYDILG